MIVEALDDAGWFAEFVARLALPFFQAAARGGVGIVRVEREQDEFVMAPRGEVG